MDVSENSGFSPQNHPLKNRVFHYFHHPVWWFSPYCWKHPYISGVMHMKYSANSKRLFICSWRLMVDTFQAWRISCGGWYKSKILPRERSNFRKFEMCAALNDRQSASNLYTAAFQAQFESHSMQVCLLADEFSTTNWYKLEGGIYKASGSLEMSHILNEILRLTACKQGVVDVKLSCSRRASFA